MKIGLKKKMFEINKTKEDTFDIFSNITFCIILLITAIWLGSPLRYNYSIVNAIIGIYGIVFIIFKKLVFKNFRFIKNKVDVFMLLLLLSSFMSLIFKTYASLNDTVIYIQLYISVYILYIVVANSNKNVILNCIINCIIIASIMFVIFGIDELTFDYFFKIFDKLNIPNIENIEKRMFSTFGYANAFAIVMAFANLLTLDKYVKTEGKLKILYGTASFVQLVGLIFSYSKATILIYGLILVIYLILLKEKDKILKTILALGINIVFAILFLRIFTTLKNTTSMENIWFIFIGMCALSILTIFILTLLEKYILMIKTKTILLITVIALSLFIIFVFLVLNISEPITAFKENSSNDMLKYGIRTLENNKEYTLVFDIEAKVLSQNKETDTYEIRIIEENKYYDPIQTKKVIFGAYNGTKEITIYLSSEASGISIEIEPIKEENKDGLTINSLYINNQEYILNYKFLPTNIMHKIKEINLSNKSAWERGVFLIDGFKAALSNNPTVGIGGNGWRYVYQEVQEYAYYSEESHSYITELFIEFGILGVISYITIIILVLDKFIKMIKNKQSNNSSKISIFLAIILLFLHSSIDFDMSFAYIIIMMYISISAIFNDVEEISKNNILRIIELIVGTILIILVISSIYFNIVQIIINLNIENISEEKAIDLVPYSREYRKNYILDLNKDIERNEKLKQMYIILNNEKYYNNLEYCKYIIITTLSCDIEESEKIKHIEKVYEILKNEPILVNIYRNNNVINYIKMVADLLNLQEEENIKIWSKKFDEIILNNYVDYLNKVTDQKSNRLEEKDISIEYESLKRYL